MRFPLSLYTSMVSSFARNALAGRSKFPLVLMLEPTLRCNLACSGCDRIRLCQNEYVPDLSLEECVQAARDSMTPVVTITGGEPMLYEELIPLVRALLGMKKHIYLCTNGLVAETFIERFRPHPRLTLNFHLDGMEETHDGITNKAGTFKKAIEGIKKAKQKGFRVSTNTSVFRTSNISELGKLFDLLKGSNVDGILISPAFNYERVEHDIFLTRDEIRERFRSMSDLFCRFPVLSSPLYIEFLKGERNMQCTPWGNPTRNPLGWKSPCYLITDTYYDSFSELMEETDWEKYEKGTDPRCRNCMVHSGYEATVMRLAFSNPRDFLRLVLWNLKMS
jgi:hopanoid biosynthesis associated radical SAM protein HpnH